MDYYDILEEMKNDVINGHIGGVRYIDTWEYEDDYSHNDIETSREKFNECANRFFEENNMPYIMREVCENAMICNKETKEIIR